MSTKHFDELKDKLNLDAFQQRREKKARARNRKKLKLKQNSNNGLIQTLASSKRNVTPEVVTFTSHRSSKNSTKDNNSEQDITTADDARPGKTVSMDQARFDVFKFGLNALSKKEQVDAKIALAIKLGAAPPKKECVPLSVLKQRRKAAKAEEEETAQQNEMKMLRKPVSKDKAGGAKKKKKAVQSKKGMKMGTFKDGILRLSASDLKKGGAKI